MDLILLVILSCIIGTSLGVFTGLTPGVHVNTVAVVLLSLSPLMVRGLGSFGLSEDLTLLLVASAIVATSMAHTFLDFIPSTFLGAPEAETALSVLPAHGMLLEGQGYKAVYISAVGSFGAVVVGFLLMIPYKLLVDPPINGYAFLKQFMVWILLAVVFLMVVSDTSKVPYVRRRDGNGRLTLENGRFSPTLGVLCAVFLFTLSGLLGLAVLDLEVPSPFGLPSSVLFPTLSGLFGTSTLLESIRGGASIPHQRIEDPRIDVGDAVSSTTTGGIAGSIVGFLPGMSGGVATVVAMIFKKDPKPSYVILTLSAINTANSFFVLCALFLILRPRSGAAIVVNELITVEAWDSVLPPLDLTLFLISSLLGSCFGFFLTIFLGGKLANVMPKLPYSKMAWSIIIFVTLMVIATTGLLGLLILAVSTAIGMIAPLIGIRRSHAMGVLLLPVVIMFW